MRRAALLILLLLLVAGSAGATVRILPLGDSMTKGSTQTPAEASHPTYRYWLWQQLQGRDADFVGSWTAPNFAYDFDQDNEGHGGYMTGGILNGVADDPGQGKLSIWLAKYQFDVALVMLGTNDVLNGVPTAESVRNLEAIIAQLRARNPNAVILLAKIPPTSIPRPGIEALNAAIPGVAARTSTSQSPVVVVDMYTGYDGVADNQAPLGIHPAESGEKKIAARWYAALQPYLGAGPTPSPTPTPVPTPSPTATSVPVTPGTAAPNVIRSPGAVVYTGESGLDVTAAGIGAGDTLGWFANGPGGNAAPVATLRIADPKHAAIPHDTRTGAWYDLDRGRTLALTVEEPAISLRLIDAETGRYVPGGEAAKGRRFDLEVSDSLSAFAARGAGAPVAVRIRDPSGRTVSTLIGDGGARISLDRLSITTTPYRIGGASGAAWNTGDAAYGAGAYELWAEGLFDHEHGTASPDPSGAVGRQVSAPVQLAVAAAPTTAPATSVPSTSAPATSAPSTAPTTAGTTAPLTTLTATTVATAAASTVAPASTTAPPTPPSGETSWWFPYFLGALALLLLIAGVGVRWAIKTPGPADSAKPRPRGSGGAPPAPPAKPANRRSPPALQIALDRVRTWDPMRGRVSGLEAALRELEQAEQARAGGRAVDLLKLVPPASIPSRPIPEQIRRWGDRVGFTPLSIDRYGDVLFYSPTPHQGGTRLVVKRANELLDRLGVDGELRR